MSPHRLCQLVALTLAGVLLLTDQLSVCQAIEVELSPFSLKLEHFQVGLGKPCGEIDQKGVMCNFGLACDLPPRATQHSCVKHIYDENAKCNQLTHWCINGMDCHFASKDAEWGTCMDPNTPLEL